MTHSFKILACLLLADTVVSCQSGSQLSHQPKPVHWTCSVATWIVQLSGTNFPSHFVPKIKIVIRKLKMARQGEFVVMTTQKPSRPGDVPHSHWRFHHLGQRPFQCECAWRWRGWASLNNISRHTEHQAHSCPCWLRLLPATAAMLNRSVD